MGSGYTESKTASKVKRHYLDKESTTCLLSGVQPTFLRWTEKPFLDEAVRQVEYPQHHVKRYYLDMQLRGEMCCVQQNKDLG